MTFISYIVHNLNALGVAQKIQVMGSLQVDDLFITSLCTSTIHLKL